MVPSKPEFWQAHAGHVITARVNLSIHLRDLLRRPSSADESNFGPEERVTAVQDACTRIQQACAALLLATEELPETSSNETTLTVALDSLVRAVTPIVEFMEAADLEAPAAGPHFVALAVAASVDALSAFALLRSRALDTRLLRALDAAIARTFALPAGRASSADSPLHTVANAVVEVSVPGILALLDADAALSIHLEASLPILAFQMSIWCKDMAGGCGEKRRKATTTWRHNVVSDCALSGAEVLHIVGRRAPWMLFESPVMPSVWAALVNIAAVDRMDDAETQLEVVDLLAKVVALAEIHSRNTGVRQT